MRLIDSFNTAEPERHIRLNLNQRAEQIVQEIVQHCHAYDPEVLSAAGEEADYVLAAIHQLPFCGAALQQPRMQHVRPEQLASRHHVLIQLDSAHPDHAAHPAPALQRTLFATEVQRAEHLQDDVACVWQRRPNL